MSGHGFVCLLLGHDYEFKTTFNRLGRHIEVKECTRCGAETEAFTGPIFPGEAENPDEAVEYIENHAERDPPDEGDPTWSWDVKDATECPHGCGLMMNPIHGDPLEPEDPYCPECGHIKGNGCEDGCYYEGATA